MYTSDAEIERIAHGLINRTLPKPDWTHAAHVAAAVWLIWSDAHNAESDMPGYIKAYNLSVGTENTDTSGYHETITFASIRMAEHLLALQEAPSLNEAVNHLLAAGLSGKDWILKYWSSEVLFSKEARKNWVEPDLKALPTRPVGDT